MTSGAMSNACTKLEPASSKINEILVKDSHFRAKVKDFNLVEYCPSSVFHCLANLESFTLAR